VDGIGGVGAEGSRAGGGGGADGSRVGGGGAGLGLAPAVGGAVAGGAVTAAVTGRPRGARPHASQ
jgi:hypothetical protein